jgi:hypothetical protein
MWSQVPTNKKAGGLYLVAGLRDSGVAVIWIEHIMHALRPGRRVHRHGHPVLTGYGDLVLIFALEAVTIGSLAGHLVFLAVLTLIFVLQQQLAPLAPGIW